MESFVTQFGDAVSAVFNGLVSIFSAIVNYLKQIVALLMRLPSWLYPFLIVFVVYCVIIFVIDR